MDNQRQYLFTSIDCAGSSIVTNQTGNTSQDIFANDIHNVEDKNVLERLAKLEEQNSALLEMVTNQSVLLTKQNVMLDNLLKVLKSKAAFYRKTYKCKK